MDYGELALRSGIAAEGVSAIPGEGYRFFLPADYCTVCKGGEGSDDCTATRLLEDGYDMQTVQELLGHRGKRTTTIYTHVLNRSARGIRSPVDSF